MKSISFCCLILGLFLGFVYAKDEYMYALFDKDKADTVKSSVLDLIMKNKDTYEDKKKFEDIQIQFEKSRRSAAYDVGNYVYVHPTSDSEPIYEVYLSSKLIEKVRAIPGVKALDSDNDKVFKKYVEDEANKITGTSTNNSTVTSNVATSTVANTTTNTVTNTTTSNATNNASNNSSHNSSDKTSSHTSSKTSGNTSGNADNIVTTTIINGNSTTSIKATPISAMSGISSNAVIKFSNVLLAIFAIYLFF
ncbi:hypothetical protein PIROE2DRAFT_9663 [Piromyces sp. E2]|nr:hypothetical protein PIROE2DRAFT_9663 [Piromyces sp. E2]|eukprot:OUM63725.1 hypothetical protein PIROE2DRAFT_9663 [Piromyces sp. E2]